MSGLQDEHSFAAGGGADGGEKKKHVRVLPAKPDPASIRAAIESQIAEVQQKADEAIAGIHEAHGTKIGDITDKHQDALAAAKNAHSTGLTEAEKPVIEQKQTIAQLEEKLRLARIDLKTKQAAFKLSKGQLKGAFYEAVGAAKETVANEFATAEQDRAAKLREENGKVDAVRQSGGNVVAAEEDALAAYNKWLRQDTHARRSAAVKAVWNMIAVIYEDAFHAEGNGVELPEVLAKRQSGGEPTPPPPAG